MKKGTNAKGTVRGTAAGVVYFAAVFAIGFFLGTVRTLVVAPAVGELAAVAIELPVILAAAWAICGWTIRRFDVPQELYVRSAMGLIAFCCLMLAEMLLSIVRLDRSLIDHFDLYRDPAA